MLYQQNPLHRPNMSKVAAVNDSWDKFASLQAEAFDPAIFDVHSKTAIIKPDACLRTADGFEGSIHQAGSHYTNNAPCNG